MTTVVIDPTIGRQTEIFEYGPEVEPAELAVLTEKLRYLSRQRQRDRAGRLAAAARRSRLVRAHASATCAAATSS